ncbi:unnamed protein product [Musa acuminata subsp. malaccensis]|uniref:(wild Malaysian banana) hypothetical protein n=1 Tax=Musa acuminata subsp. malaccensis TaxID=214687 RepID=A0A804JH12_MUSAM|nr:unnamed protein product [Musa acuminata subsp. malaccensis]
MEGLIPFLYRAFVRYSNGEQSPMRNILFNESPSASYMRLPGDSGRLLSSEIHFFSSSLQPPPAPQSPPRRTAPRSRPT